jgi:hypothetical protein
MRHLSKAGRCAGGFSEVAKRCSTRLPGALLSAGLLGYGSDVLDYDDPASGTYVGAAIFSVFGHDRVIGRREAVRTASRAFSYVFLGFSVQFLRSGPFRREVVCAIRSRSQAACAALIFSAPFRITWKSYPGARDSIVWGGADGCPSASIGSWGLTSGTLVDGWASGRSFKKFPIIRWRFGCISSRPIGRHRRGAGVCAPCADVATKWAPSGLRAHRAAVMQLAFLTVGSTRLFQMVRHGIFPAAY